MNPGRSFRSIVWRCASGLAIGAAIALVADGGGAGSGVVWAHAPATLPSDAASTRPFPQWLERGTATGDAPAAVAPAPRLVGGEIAVDTESTFGVASPAQGIVGSDNDVLRVTTTKGPCGPSLTYTDGEVAYFRFQSSQAGPLSIYYPGSRGEVFVRTIDLPANTVYRYTPTIDATNGGTNMYVRLIQPGNHAQAYCSFTVEATTSSLCAWATPMFEECGDTYYETELESCATGRTYWYAGELAATGDTGSALAGALPAQYPPSDTSVPALGPPAPASTARYAALWAFENPRVAWNADCYAYVLTSWGRAQLVGYAPNVSCASCPSSSDRGGSINLWTQRGSFYQCDGVFQNGETLRVFVRAGQSGPTTLYVHHSDNTRSTFELGRLTAGVTYFQDFTIDDDPPGRQMMYVQQTGMRALDTCSYIVDIPRMCQTLGGLSVRTVPETPIADEPFTIVVSGTSLNGCPPGQISLRVHEGIIYLDLPWGACSRSCGGASVFWEREIEVHGLPADSYPTSVSLACNGRSEMCDDGVITVIERPKPVFILLPGVAASVLDNTTGHVLRQGEVWPNITQLLAARPLFLNRLDGLRLQNDGFRPRTSGDVIEARMPIWTAPTINKDFYKDFYETFRLTLKDRGVTLWPCPYDWRLAVDSKTTMDTVARCIAEASDGNANAATHDADGVASVLGPPTRPIVLVGHSLGGIVARAFVSDEDRAATVDRIITVGTPYLGAPVMLMRMPTGVTGMWPHDADPDIVKKVAEVYRNAPAFQYLLPSSDYGGAARLYKNGEAVPFGQQIDLFGSIALNVPLIEKARSLHNDLDNLGVNLPVPIHVLASRGQSNTPQSINVQQSRLKVGKLVFVLSIFSTRSVGHGDGTVPLVAAMADPSWSVFRPGAAHVCLYSAASLASSKKPKDHGQLLSDANVIDDVIRLGYGEGPAHCRTIRAGAGVPMAGGAASRDAAATEADDGALEGSAYEIDIAGAASVLAEDTATGAKVGTDRDGTIYDDWQGAELHALAEHFVRVAFADEYRDGPSAIYIVPEAGAEPEITIRRYAAAGEDERMVDERVRFVDLPPVPAGGAYRVNLPLDSNVAASLDVLDAANTVRRTIGPSHVLRGGAATDSVPPTVSLDVQRGRVMSVVVHAQDADSGVGEVLYSIDGGTEWSPYNGPIRLAPGFKGTVQAFATDRAGNTSWPPAEVAVSAPLPMVYLPHLAVRVLIR